MKIDVKVCGINGTRLITGIWDSVEEMLCELSKDFTIINYWVTKN